MSVSIVSATSYDKNTVKKSLLKAFELLGMDSQNPFKDIIKPGDTVFIKPNWVAHRYRASCPYQYDIYSTITHPSVIKEVAKFADVAMQGEGQITIGDNPSIDADFDALMKLQDLEELKSELKTKIQFIDLRPLICANLKDYGLKHKMVAAKGDPQGETIVNLGAKSVLSGLNPKLFRGVFNERIETINAHSGDTQLYSFSNSIFNSDVYISIPKLKTHHKVGTTLNLKGLVGTVGAKNYLVHWREGFPLMGGDAYPGFWSWFLDKFRKTKKRGAWSGNDTIWRMVVDLYSGIKKGPKKNFTIIDGIMGGEGDGPFCPEPKESKVLLAGTDFLEADIVASRLMGFNVSEIPYLNYYLSKGIIKKSDITLFSEFDNTEHFFESSVEHLQFKPPSKWSNLVL